MFDYDRNSPEAHLLFDLCFPFMRHDDDGNSIVNNDYDMYRCADITISMLKSEMYKHNMPIPEHYEKAHLIITYKLLEKQGLIKQLNK